MNYDPQTLEVALNATSVSEFDTEIFRFKDKRLRYEIHLYPNDGTGILAMDPTEPIQGCPMLEFSFRCTDIQIGTSAYCVEGDEIAIRFYDGDVSESGHRLTMTWIPEGYWYIWANANAKS